MLLEAQGVKKTYWVDHQPLDVLKGVDLTIAEGELTAIVGPSGAGKSTMLHLLGGLDEPTAGRVLLDGMDLRSMPDAARAAQRNAHIGFVFQFYHLIAELSCLENVMLPGLLSRPRKSRAALAGEAKELLKEMGLEERMGHKPRQLSGGEQQRCAIARALINRPRVLLADEPTGNLDRQTSRGILEMLERLKQSRGVTMVMVTHDEELAAVCSRKVHMMDGRLT